MNGIDVHKIGGKGLRNADGFKNVGEIIRTLPTNRNYLIVVSAVEDMTRLLDKICVAWMDDDKDLAAARSHEFKEIHSAIIRRIFQAKNRKLVDDKLSALLGSPTGLKYALGHGRDRDARRAAILSFGERASSMILTEYLIREVFCSTAKVSLADARKMIWTLGKIDEAHIDPNLSRKRTKNIILSLLVNHGIVVTQGFIGNDISSDKVSTLPFNGSDTSAAWFGNFLGAGEVTFWKDVPGVLAEDPAKNENAKAFASMTYAELTEHLKNGCSVIHPDAVAPLQEAGIPMRIRSFNNLADLGTLIS